MRAFVFLLALAGCAPLAGPPEPLSARLSSQALTVETTAGQLCRIPRAEAAFDGPGGWGGPVQGCPGVARVEVVPERPAPLAQVAAALFAALTLEDLISPPAEVRVLGPDGRVFLFVSPPPME